MYTRLGSDRQDGDDLFIRSADARQTSSLLLTPNIQPKLYDVHTQSAANSWSLPLPSPVSWRVFIIMGLKKNNSGKYSSAPDIKGHCGPGPLSLCSPDGLGLATIQS